nr:hypothetical protein [Vibrio vulnificus]
MKVACGSLVYAAFTP